MNVFCFLFFVFCFLLATCYAIIFSVASLLVKLFCPGQYSSYVVLRWRRTLVLQSFLVLLFNSLPF